MLRVPQADDVIVVNMEGAEKTFEVNDHLVDVPEPEVGHFIAAVRGTDRVREDSSDAPASQAAPPSSASTPPTPVSPSPTASRTITSTSTEGEGN